MDWSKILPPPNRHNGALPVSLTLPYFISHSHLCFATKLCSICHFSDRLSIKIRCTVLDIYHRLIKRGCIKASLITNTHPNRVPSTPILSISKIWLVPAAHCTHPEHATDTQTYCCDVPTVWPRLTRLIIMKGRLVEMDVTSAKTIRHFP